MRTLINLTHLSASPDRLVFWTCALAFALAWMLP